MAERSDRRCTSARGGIFYSCKPERARTRRIARALLARSACARQRPPLFARQPAGIIAFGHVNSFPIFASPCRGEAAARSAAVGESAKATAPPRAPSVRDPPPAGEGEMIFIPATQSAPEFCRPKPRNFCLQKIRGGGAPKRRNCLVGPRHAIRCCHPNRASGAAARPSGTRSPLGAPPRLSLRPCAEAQSRPRFTRCSAQAFPAGLAPRLSEAPRAPVVMPAGSMPGPRESGSDELPLAGTAPAPSVGVTG